MSNKLHVQGYQQSKTKIISLITEVQKKDDRMN